MKIHGLQKMTLLDYPGHVACTVFLNGCDFRCPFCHNFELADGSAPAVTDDEELLAFLRKRQGLLDGVAFTGGEPLLHRELPELIRKIRDLGFLIKVDTNGFHPDMLSSLLEEKLVDYAAMDVKNSPEKYARTAGLAELDLTPVRESIRILKDNGMTSSPGTAPAGPDDRKWLFDYEFRTTVVREFHEETDFFAIGDMIAGARRYFLQAFTDRDSVPCGGLHAPAAGEMQRYAEIMRAYVPDTQLRGID